MTKRNILVLCTGNSCRSQMAEGFLRQLAGVQFDVFSAGTRPAERVHPLAVQVMAETGINISAQRPKPVQEFLGRLQITHLIIVCDGANEECPRTFTSVLHRHFWPFDDPAQLTGTPDEILAGFRRVRDEIQRKVEDWATQGFPS